MTEDRLNPPTKNSGRKKAGGGTVGGAGPPGTADDKGESTTARRNKRLAGIRPRISIEELRNAFKRQASIPQEDNESVFDPMAKAQESKDVVRGKTGVVYDEFMANHTCLWDSNYPECPERLLCCLDRCKELKLFDRCKRLASRKATEEEILKLHTRTHLDLLRYTKGEKDAERLESVSSHYDAIYIHPDTFDVAMLAAGSTFTLVDNIVTGKLQNGMALIRPPGHHAMKSEYCGYSFLNNVALAAHRAVEKFNMSRVLIVDWDVHHGQGTQQLFYEDPRVLYFSIHRYENGSFWPELRESDYTYIGSGPGRGFNFNVPLNKTGMKNEDYLAIFHQVLLPVAYEFNPELILISSGYDAAVGCPEFAPELVVVSAGYDSALGDEKGEMEVTPAFYAHLTSSLMSLAGGKVAVVLEGGYCLESLSEGAAKTLSALLGDPCPQLMDPLLKPSQSIQESILNLIYVHRPFWKCFQYQSSYSVSEENDNTKHLPSVNFLGKEPKPLIYETRNCYPVPSTVKLEEISVQLKKLKDVECSRDIPSYKLSLVYDEEMNKHRNLSEKEHPERPERIARIWKYLKQFGIVERALLLASRMATRKEVEMVHSKDHVDLMYSLGSLTDENIQDLQEKYKSIYLHPSSNDAALLSSGSLLQVVDSVCCGESQSGIGVIRPPGHHAEQDRPHGFCMYNNVAVAAKYALEKYGYQRVLIVDWDVHHGNGIQHTFESNPNILYVSIHRYDDGIFFPSSEDGNYDKVGTGRGEGFNVNIPWNKSGMGDAEYMSAMLQVVMPIAYQFDPQLVLVSAGFDAARGDPLGGCRVTPECYGHMTHLLASLAGGRIILALEGGYNLNVISYCMTMCAKALLGDPLPVLDNGLVPNKKAVEAITDVIKTHSKYWPCLCFQIALPLEDVLAQGFGGLPQAVESGKSGSEVSSQSSSPVSSPSTASPMYVSAPSSPDKPVKEERLGDNLVKNIGYECEAEMLVDQCTTTSPKIACTDSLEMSVTSCNEKPMKSTNSSPEYATPTSTPKGKSVAKGNNLSQKSSESPLKNYESKKGSRTVTPVKSRKPRRSGINSFLTTAAASISVVKKATAVVLSESTCNGEHVVDSELRKRLGNYCHGHQLLDNCMSLASRKANATELPFVLADEFIREPGVETEKDNIWRAIGSVTNVIKKVVDASCQNGMAVIQPNDNQVVRSDDCHAWNLSAIGAKYAIDSLNVTRVLVIDLDGSWNKGHHTFCADERILRFCLYLQCDHQAKTSKQNSSKGCDACDSSFNIGLDCHSFQSEDYYTVLQQLILPVAYEFSPELVIVSMTYKTAAHCRNVFPVVYAHVIGLLMTLAEGRIIVVSELGPYESVAVEGIAASLSALQDIPNKNMLGAMESASPNTKIEVLDVFVDKKYFWKALQSHAQISCAFSRSAKPKVELADSCTQEFVEDIKKYASSSADKKVVNPLCLVYDDSMLSHFNYEDSTHPECPERIRCIYKRLQEFGIIERCLPVKARQATVKELEDLHSPKHLRFMSSISSKKPNELINLQENYESVFLHRQTNNAALIAAGSVVAVVDSVLKGECHRGLAVVRPPGHHAERNEPCGFCFYNNVAVGAKHAINAFGLKRVLILDWDVHHGNGIQHMFESDPRVLYISIHRYDNGRFFPGSTEANYNRVGIKKGKGFNVNIPWNKGSMGDGDYIAAMTEVVLPIAFQFNPQLVMVSAGFDAAVGDPLGGCLVTPECYGHMSKLLMQLAEGKVIITLEGGYNLSTISYCMTMCAKALLGDPIASLGTGLTACQSAIDTLANVVSTHKKFWSALDLKNTSSSSPVNSYDLPSPVSLDNLESKNKKVLIEASAPTLDELSAGLRGVTLEDQVEKQRISVQVLNMADSPPEAGPSKSSDTGESLEGAVGGASGIPDSEQMFAVIPLTWCPHLEKVNSVPNSGLNTGGSCEECQDPSENWVCLTCYKVLCGRFVNEHMLMHGVTEEHYMVLSYSDFSVWCYSCDAYVHHEILQEAKRAAHIHKFGEDIPNSS